LGSKVIGRGLKTKHSSKSECKGTADYMNLEPRLGEKRPQEAKRNEQP